MLSRIAQRVPRARMISRAMATSSQHIYTSPCGNIDIPNVSLPEYLFQVCCEICPCMIL